MFCFFFNFFFSPFVLKTSCSASGRAEKKPGAARHAGSVLALPPRTQTPGHGIIWPGLRSPASAVTIKRYLEELTGDSGARAAGPRTRLGGEARARTRGNVTPARFLVQAGTMLEEGTIACFQVRRLGTVGGGHCQAGRFSGDRWPEPHPSLSDREAEGRPRFARAFVIGKCFWLSRRYACLCVHACG